MSIRISIAGIAGRMGRELVRIAHDNNMAIAGGSVRSGSAFIGEDIGLIQGGPALGVTASDDPLVAVSDAPVWIDFTTPEATLSALDALSGHPHLKVAIIGTTGFNPEQEARIVEHSHGLAIVKAGNFSMGAAMLCLLVKQAACHLGTGWDIDILDTHHTKKKDAPSGTALMLGEAASAGRGASLEAHALPPYSGTGLKRPSGGIGFAVRRAGTIIGEHEVIMAGAGETLSLRHTAHDRGIFARGALSAAQWALDKPAGLYAMADLLQTM